MPAWRAGVVICTIVGAALAAVTRRSRDERPAPGIVIRVLSIGPLLSIFIAELSPAPVSFTTLAILGGVGTVTTNVTLILLLAAPLSAMAYRLLVHRGNRMTREAVTGIVALGLLATLAAIAILESGPGYLGIGYPPPLGGWGSIGPSMQHLDEAPWIIISSGGALTIALASLIALSVAIGRLWKRIEAVAAIVQEAPSSPLVEPVATR